ncbi:MULTISPECIES: TIGR03086 family metal-binding protein [Nocardia]|uniref:TIGR03086 family metal-binding protein n=1 Tax=Nocardia TaxID=1817 RepID=UPI000D69EF3C|nr:MULTISPECIES: TIGR03086 family metal-binding protein [Nocardia]
MTLDSLVPASDLLAHHAAAVRTSIRIVDHVTPADLRKPTPCADWTLHGLLTHMIAQHRGFAAASRGIGEVERWKTRPLGDDPAGDYRASAEDVLAAFAEPGVLEREFPLPEFSPTHLFPGAQAVGFHFIDYVVHSWDVARTLGIPVDFDAAVLAAARPVAAAVPGGSIRTAPGSAFGPAVPWHGTATLDEIVAMLGRAPDWRD